MKPLVKWIACISCVLLLVACGSRSKHVSLEKDGTLYTIGNEVSFYYPNGYTLDSTHGLDKKGNSLVFNKDDETIFYTSIDDQTDNANDEKDDLYTAQLEQEGASNIVISKPILSSGITVYEITGTYQSTGIRFKHIVYFTDVRTFVYGYFAASDLYNDNIETITEFLQSISINDTPAT